MRNWSADFGNDPNNDYNPIIEILCEDEEVAVIKEGKSGLEIKWYPNKEELIIPLDWLQGLLIEAKKRMNKTI